MLSVLDEEGVKEIFLPKCWSCQNQWCGWKSLILFLGAGMDLLVTPM